jgi:hypothetical protein
VPTAAEESVTDDRAARLHELGFTALQASALSVTRDHNGVLIHIGRIGKMLDGGCPHRLIVKIFL